MITALIDITLKEGVLDPTAQTVLRTANRLGFAGISAIKQHKQFEITLAETDRARAKKTLTAFCEQVLANEVIETYRITLKE